MICTVIFCLVFTAPAKWRVELRAKICQDRNRCLRLQVPGNVSSGSGLTVYFINNYGIVGKVKVMELLRTLIELVRTIILISVCLQFNWICQQIFHPIIE